MSSVTISTTVWPLVQPNSSTVGVKTRTLAVPCGRCAGELAVRQGRAGEVDRVALGEVLGGHVPVVQRQEPAETVLVVAAPFGRLRGPRDDLAALALQRRLLRLRHLTPRLDPVAGTHRRAPSSSRTLPPARPAGTEPAGPLWTTGSRRPQDRWLCRRAAAVGLWVNRVGIGSAGVRLSSRCSPTAHPTLADRPPQLEDQVRLSAEIRYDAEPAAVVAMLTDVDFQERKCEATGALESEVRDRDLRRTAP